MDHVVPGPLRRLREADIIDMAGLKSAALGQEYYRIGAVHSTMLKGSQITGIVDVPTRTNNDASRDRSPGIVDMYDITPEKAASPTNSIEEAKRASKAQTTHEVDARPGRYHVTVVIQDHNARYATCTCHTSSDSFSICPHAAALLYQWLAHPTTFVSSRTASSYTPSRPPSYSDVETERSNDGHGGLRRIPVPQTGHPSGGADNVSLPPPSQLQPAKLSVEHVIMAHGTTLTINELLSQLSLNELRPLAREYDITTTGLNKQQLIEAIVETLKHPEIIRRVVSTLEKPQRQLLAALTLAGGLVTDEELRGLYERFSLGYPNQLQAVLSALRTKCLIFHTNFDNQTSVAGSFVDVGWYVPTEIRTALHVTVPITPFDVQATKDSRTEAPNISQIKPYALLEDLLLVARALDGQQDFEASGQRKGSVNSFGARSTRRITSPLTPPTDGLMQVPPPQDMPLPSLVESLHPLKEDRFSADFLRFAVRLLRLVDILYKDDSGTSYLSILPNAARLLLSPTRTEVAHDLFVRWLTQPTYAELFELQEEGLRLRCRMASSGRPALRVGEIEVENSEARQMLIALLAKVPLNQWVNFAAFARFVFRLNPTFLQKRHNLYSSPAWWFEQEEGRTLHPTQLNDWLQVEGCYIARLLRGPLFWWGICDLALSNSGQLLAFRLTPLAGLLVHGKRQSANNRKENITGSDHDTPLLLSETGDILVSSNATAWPLVELLENFAEIAGVQQGRLRYRLTATSLGQALSHGLQPATLLQLLHKYTQPSMTLLLAQLERRIKNYGRVRLYTDVTLLEVADTSVIRELTATTPLEEQVVRTIQPTLLILKKPGAERLVQEMKRRGQVPLIHEEEDYGAE
jgi:hypothetical protein